MDVEHQATMLQNRVAKTFRKLKGQFAQAHVGAFRLYDRDIPEIRLAIDWYEGHLVVGEYSRRQHEAIPGWAQHMAQAVAERLQVPPEQVHLKVRRTRPEAGPRYQRLERRDTRIQVREGPLRFWVNLTDYLDTGLFLDHRRTRQLVQKECRDRDVLNLYGYTGSFTCAAALGQARHTVTVDRSRRYLDWARDNLQLNGFDGQQHQLVSADSQTFLARAARDGQRFDLVILDPPSYSTAGQDQALDIQRDHGELVAASLALLRPHGVLWFSTNHQRFEPLLNGLPIQEATEMTAQTVPIDFRNRSAHRSFRLVKSP